MQKISATTYSGAAAVCAALLVYGLTLAPGVGFIDSGELAAVCARLGIAHPTGYPLYTLLGWLFLQLPSSLRPIFMLNSMSALCAGLALGSFYLLLRRLFLVAAPDVHGLPEQPVAMACGCGTLLLGFSSVFWSTALVTEVYALHAFFIIFLLQLATRIFGPAPPGGRAGFGWCLLLFSVLGLSFCNHMGTVLLLPGLAFIMLSQWRIWRPDGKKIVLLAASLGAGLCLYLYLPLRAAQDPVLNWGNPRTWQTFLWHVTGRQYRVWMFSSAEAAAQNVEYFLRLVLDAYGYVPVILVPAGIWYLLRVSRPLSLFFAILFAADIIYAINYDINDIDTYFLPAFVVCSLWMTGGLIFFMGLIKARLPRAARWVPAGLGGLVLIPLVYHYPAVNQNKASLVEQYVQNVLGSVEMNGLVLSYQWDYFCAPFCYLQLVEAVRPDVTMIEVQLLRRSWYLEQLCRQCPEVMQTSKAELDQFSRELFKFEHGLPYDPQTIQRCYLELINSFIRRTMPTRPVYLTCEQGQEVGAGFTRVPEGLVFRLYPPAQVYTLYNLAGLDMPGPQSFNPDNRYQAALRSFYAFMLSARGTYELQYGHTAEARGLFQQALAMYPGYQLAQQGLTALPAVR